LNNLLCFL